MYQILNFIIIAFFTLSSCTTIKNENNDFKPALELYNEGKALLNEQKYKEAAKKFENIYFQHPGSKISTYAELMEAYSLYLIKEFDEASDVLENFIKLHPIHEDISYAYYLRGLCYFSQIITMLNNVEKIVQAKLALEDIINRFNTSRYFKDSLLKLNIVDASIAGHHMHIGKYYLTRNNPISAIIRFNQVIQEYNSTIYVPEVLYRLAESYYMLGLKSESQNYINKLIKNYPNNKWIKYSKKLLLSK